MTAKEYLSEAINIKIRLKAMAEQLAFLKSAAEYIPTQFSDMPKSATRNIHKNEDTIVRMMEFKERMNVHYAKLDGINKTIESISDSTLQTLLVKRYLEGKTWQETGSEMYFSNAHVYRLHNAALAEVEAMIANES